MLVNINGVVDKQGINVCGDVSVRRGSNDKDYGGSGLGGW